MTMKAENDVLGRGLTLPTLYNIVQCRVLHKLVRVNYLSNVFLFLAVNRDKDFFSRMTQGDRASHSIQCFVIIFYQNYKIVLSNQSNISQIQPMFVIEPLYKIFIVNIIIFLLRNESSLASLSVLVDICENKNVVIIRLIFMLKTR